MFVDNKNIEFEGYFTVACNGSNLWRAKKGLPYFYFRQPLGNPTYSSPNLATLVILLTFIYYTGSKKSESQLLYNGSVFTRAYLGGSWLRVV